MLFPRVHADLSCACSNKFPCCSKARGRTLGAKDFVTCTQQKMNNLFQVDENSIEQYFAAHIVLDC